MFFCLYFYFYFYLTILFVGFMGISLSLNLNVFTLCVLTQPLFFFYRNESLEHERQMRENAEKELVESLSMNGVVRGNLTPSPTMIRSQMESPIQGTRSSTPRIHLGSMETMIEELKSARLLNHTVSL